MMQQEFEFERLTARVENRSPRWRAQLVRDLKTLGIVVPGLSRSLVGTVNAIVMHLTGSVLPPERQVAPTKKRARVLDDLFRVACAPIDRSWPEHLVEQVAEVVEIEGITDMVAAFELTRVVVSVALEAHGADLHDRDVQAAVRWADEAGYLSGSWCAEQVAHADALALAHDDLEAAVVRLERAIHHRRGRYEPFDSLLPHLHLQAAAWRADLGDHHVALEHFQAAYPARDAVEDPTDPEVVSSLRAAVDSCCLVQRVPQAIEYQREVVRRMQFVAERRRSFGADLSSRQRWRAALVPDELKLAHLHLLNDDPCSTLAVLDVVDRLDSAVVRPGSRHHTVALGLRAQAYDHLGRDADAQALARRTLPQARRHFGYDDPLVLALEEMDGEDRP
jgi:hypothetical protein